MNCLRPAPPARSFFQADKRNTLRRKGDFPFLERLTANAKVATVLASIPASSDTMEFEGRQISAEYCTTFFLL
jgi:hypothetical protein